MEWGITKAGKPMNPVRVNGSTIKRYLLGDLAEEQCEQLEERLLTEDETFQELLLVEDELVNDYVAGELPDTDREKFISHFLCTPERRQKLEFASALRRYVSENRVAERPAKNNSTHQPLNWRQSFLTHVPSRNPVVAGALAAAFGVMMVGGLWSILEIGRLHDQIDRIRTEQSAASRQAGDSQRQLADQLAGGLRREQDQAAALKMEVDRLANAINTRRGVAGSGVVAVMLTPGLVRGEEGTKRLSITSESSWVQLKLNLPPGEYEKYQASLQRIGGEETLVGNNLPAPAGTSRLVNLTIPAEIFVTADYALKLKGISAGGANEDAATYYFRVIKR